MVITYHEAGFFKVSFGSTTLAFNPIAKESSYRQSTMAADIALISCWHPDFNGVASVSRGSAEPFVIDGPGAYEVGDVTVRGFGVPTTYDGEARFNTIYDVQLEGMHLVMLGPLASGELGNDILGSLGAIDVLFTPIGDGDVLSPSEASKLSVKLEARCVIPMLYDDAALKAFLKEESAESTTPTEKLTLKQRDVATMEGAIAVLTP